MRKLISILISIITLATVSVAQAPSPARYLLDEALITLEERYFGFEQINFSALNTDAARRLELDCKDLTPCPFVVAERILDDLLVHVGDGHTFRLSPIAWAQFVANSNNSSLPMVGLKFAALPDASALVVTRVLEGSPAMLAGIRRGDTIWSVNGVSLEQFSSEAQAINEITALEFSGQRIRLELSGRTTGRKFVTLEPVALKPWLPSYELRGDGVAVISFYQYLTNGLIASSVHEYVRQAKIAGAKAIVLDVRGSGGGSGYESVASAGAFVEPVGTQFENVRSLGSIVYQNGAIANSGFRLVNPQSYKGPLIVLANHISRSAAEYMAFFLQQAGRARVIGEPTAGVLNTSTSIYPLPGGSSLAVTSGRSKTMSGVPHPERVTPDIVMNDDMAALARGRDLVLEKAIELLQ